MKQTAVEYLADRYNYLIWMRNRDEISAGTADEWRAKFLKIAKEMEEKEIKDAWLAAWKDSMLNPLSDEHYQDLAEEYYNDTYKNN